MRNILMGQVSRRRFLLSSMAGIPIPGLMLHSQQQSNPQPIAESLTAEDILIGAYLPLTGATAPFGIATRNSIDLAADVLNKAGGLLGKRVRILVEDDQGRAQEAQRVVTRLITQDRVIALLGEVSSSNTLAAAPFAQQNRVPMISPSATHERVTRVGDYIFRACFIDPFHGFVMAKFAAGTLKGRRAAILRDGKSDYSVGLAAAFSEGFTKLGGNVMTVETYGAGDTDFATQLNTIKAANADVIFVPGYYTEAALIAVQAKKLALNAPLLGGDGWDFPKQAGRIAESLNGSYYSNHYSVDNPSPENRSFVARYQEMYRETPDPLAALAFDSANLLFDAIRRANSTEAPRIRAALAETKDFRGVTGPISFDPDRNPIKPAAVLQVKDGKVVLVETVAP